jgi:hypothetical protein
MSLLVGALGGAGDAAEKIGETNQKAFVESSLMATRAQLEAQKEITVQAAMLGLKQQYQLNALGYPQDGGSSSAAPTGGSAAPVGLVAQARSPGDGSSGAAPTQAASGQQVGQAVAAKLANTEPAAWDLPNIAKTYNIPLPALRNLAAAQDFKGIGDLIASRSLGHKTVVNGVVIDMDKAPEGIVDGQTFTSTDGKVVQLKKNADGSVSVTSPTGALGVQKAQEQATADVKNANALREVYDPQSKRKVYMTDAQILARAGLQGSQPAAPTGVPAGVPAAPVGNGDNLPPPQPGIKGAFDFTKDSPENISMAIANIPDPQERANAQTAFESQMRQSAGAPNTSVAGAGPNAQTAPGADTGPVAAGPSAADAAQAEGDKQFRGQRAQKIAAYEDGLNNRVQQGQDLNMRLQAQVQDLKNFRAGGGTETRAHIAQAAQALGMPKNIVDGIAGGDLGSIQAFDKLAAQTAMEQLKQSMGGSGRITQAEFKVFSERNPNPSTDPEAIGKMFAFATHVMQRDMAEQRAYNAYLKNGGDPADFPNVWTSMAMKLGYVDPAATKYLGQSGK